MDFIDKYFKEKTKEITFIELKDTSQIEFKGITIDDEVPLPILTNQLIENLKDGEMEDEININYIIEGIIYTMGVDPSFPYIDEYKSILMAYDENIKDYILYEVTKDFQNDKYDSGAIKLRALLILDENNVNALLNYAIAIEEIAKEYMGKEKVEEGEKFLRYSTEKLETILNINKNFAPAYYKLGYHYKYFQQFLKASITWEKFLLFSKEDLLNQEIREEMEIIEDDVNMETGLTYLNYMDYEKALGYFLKLIPKHKGNWNVNYLIGQTYGGAGQYDLAIDYMGKALELNPEQADIYNELGIIYFNKNDILKAVDVFTDGIKNCKEDYKLFFNRGLGYVQLEQYMKGLKDINKAFDLNPKDENIIVQKEALENLLSNIS